MRIGDVVTLRSGGAPMTVSAIGPCEDGRLADGMVRTCWMESENGYPKLKYGYFPRAMLTEPELREAGPLPS